MNETPQNSPEATRVVLPPSPAAAAKPAAPAKPRISAAAKSPRALRGGDSAEFAKAMRKTHRARLSSDYNIFSPSFRGLATRRELWVTGLLFLLQNIAYRFLNQLLRCAQWVAVAGLLVWLVHCLWVLCEMADSPYPIAMPSDWWVPPVSGFVSLGFFLILALWPGRSHRPAPAVQAAPSDGAASENSTH